jgi:hypothetical protein
MRWGWVPERFTAEWTAHDAVFSTTRVAHVKSPRAPLIMKAQVHDDSPCKGRACTLHSASCWDLIHQLLLSLSWSLGKTNCIVTLYLGNLTSCEKFSENKGNSAVNSEYIGSALLRGTVPNSAGVSARNCDCRIVLWLITESAWDSIKCRSVLLCDSWRSTDSNNGEFESMMKMQHEHPSYN